MLAPVGAVFARACTPPGSVGIPPVAIRRVFAAHSGAGRPGTGGTRERNPPRADAFEINKSLARDAVAFGIISVRKRMTNES